MDEKLSLLGLSIQELTAAFASIGIAPYRAKQCFSWIYSRGVDDFQTMGNLPKADREALQDIFQ